MKELYSLLLLSSTQHRPLSTNMQKNFIQMASPFHRYFSIGSSELADDLSYPFITFIAFLNEVASFSFQPSHRTISHSSTLSIPNEQTRRNNEKETTMIPIFHDTLKVS